MTVELRHFLEGLLLVNGALLPMPRVSSYNYGLASIKAGVAQLVEQRIRNAKVGSSTLFAGTKQELVFSDSRARSDAGPFVFGRVPEINIGDVHGTKIAPTSV